MRCLTLAAAAFLCACAAPPDPPALISSQPAGVRWRRGTHVLDAPATLERFANGAIIFRLGREEELIRLHLDPKNRLEARGRLARPDWRGPVGDAPAALSTWISLLLVLQHADKVPDGQRELHTAAARIAVDKSNGKLHTLSILNTDNGEILSLRFAGKSP